MTNTRGYGDTFAICGQCHRLLEKAPSATDGEPCFRGYHSCTEHPKSETIYVDAQYKTSSEVGPTISPKCPDCRNSLQNAVPYGTPYLRRCASCKCVWHYSPTTRAPYRLKDMSDYDAKVILQHYLIGLSRKPVHELTQIERNLIDCCSENPNGH